MRETPTNLKGKKHSSQLWLMRQMKDPYVEKAKQENYRCRSAFKLLEINEKHHILYPGRIVIDCGAAPGSWTQVAVKLTNAEGKKLDQKKGAVIAIDKLPIHDIKGAKIFCNLDFTADETHRMLTELLGGKEVDLVMSDMAPNASGAKRLDHENIIKLAYSAFKFALNVSSFEGDYLAKVWDGNLSHQLEKDLSKFYKRVRIIKPFASRQESAEKYILAQGFKGIQTQKIS